MGFTVWGKSVHDVGMMNVVELLQTLIRIPSVNSDNAPGTELVDEQGVADFLVGYLGDGGFDVVQEEVLPGRPNVIARAPYSGEGVDERPRILLGPHMDTVGVAGMVFDPFCGDLVDGKVLGRGASDTKGPMAAMITALLECVELLGELPVAVDFVAFMGEESVQQGSRHFAEHHGGEYVFAIAGEPTSLDVVNVTKGCAWLTVEAVGKAAHSSQPERGENAIMILARSLDMMNRKLCNRLATYTHPVLGHSTLNVGTLHGGTRPNIVPDFAVAELDIRTTPSLMLAGGGRGVTEGFIEEMGLPVRVSGSHENPPMETGEDNEFVQKLLGAWPGARCVGAPWFSDAAHLGAGGIPSVCVGPGSIDQAHTKDEFIIVKDLEEGVEFFGAFIRSLVNGQ
ncbi:MAG: M20 family metallopeptidase [Akkermansiaceae bacterium]